ncbi:hypothetical protein O4J56_27960 [Nocardiopsis sp. RSe5-2]|uniref:Uncharacterized protein n=1 Tax=Nocardiopsis endophytica TaxID=3018445 RepID=A0ABT4UC34_9ACTN|nr:hypothetical protein [Nocardiopsis endophytica]MDA2814513.1 hypothetical protein [Nocardiopsis endophytica]
MTTTPEDGGAQTPRDDDRTDGGRTGPDFAPAAVADESGRPAQEPGAGEAAEGAYAARAEPGAEEGAEADDTQGRAAPKRFASVLTAEAFGIGSVLALLASFAGTRAVEIVASVTATSQEGMLKALALGDGVPALLAAILAAGSLSVAGPDTRSWARWLAGGVLIVAVLALFGAVGAYLLVPPPAPMPPMVPGN